MYTPLAALSLALSLFPTQVESIVAGIDFGGEFFKIALVKPGTPFEIVTNIHSKRKTETMVAFDGDDRLYGADAATIGVRRPQAAYSQIRRMIGTSADHPSVTALVAAEYYPYTLVANETRGSIGISHQKGDTTFHAEELVAMVFSHAKDITAAFAQAPVKDWVLTVPSYFTQGQRQALLDAASLTDIRVLSLIDENTAAAVQYGIDRIYDKPFRVLYYNMGSSSVQVSVVEYDSYVVPDGFQKNKTVGSFSTLAKAWDTTLGGSAFDLRLTEMLADQVNVKLKLGNEDIRSQPRPMAKIRAMAKKTKIVLSANEQIPVVMQSLYKDVDFLGHVTRAEFETLCADLFQRALIPVTDALTQAGLTMEDMDELEILGGGVRMPKLQSLLKGAYGSKELGVHLNGDEAMALGAAFRAANISNAFRVRTVGMEDIYPYAIGVRLVDVDESAPEGSDDAWIKRAVVFKPNTRLGSRKVVSFVHASDFSCTFSYDTTVVSLPEGMLPHIATYNITGLQAFVTRMADKGLTADVKVSMSFYLDPSGMVNLVKVEASMEEVLPVEPVVLDVETGDDAALDVEDNPDANVKASDTQEGEADKAPESKDATTETDTTEKVDVSAPVVPKTKLHRQALSVNFAHASHVSGLAVLPMTLVEKATSVAMLREMQVLDDARVEKAEEKNTLESYVYSSRASVAESQAAILAAGVASVEDVEALTTRIDATEEWLEEEGEDPDVKADVYRAKYRSIASTLQGMLSRLAETTSRPAAVTRAIGFITSTRELLASDEWSDEAKPQVSTSEKTSLEKSIDTFERWMEEKVTAQDALALTETPVFTSQELLAKLKDEKRKLTFLAKRPLPPPKEEAPSNSTESTNTTNGTTTTETLQDDPASVNGTTLEPENKTVEEPLERKDEL